MKALIWGAGECYEKNANLIQYHIGRGMEVVGITSDDVNFGKLDGFSFIAKNSVADVDFDFILVCIMNISSSLMKEICEISKREETCIYSVSILQVFDLDFEKLLRLSNQKLSIFANNCWGGYAYNLFGQQFRSPFINMYENDQEWVNFLKNPKESIREGIVLAEAKRNGTKDWPVFDLSGLKLYMLHYRDGVEIAEKKWNERVVRINWDSLFVHMYSEDENVIEQFCELPYRKKIVFTPCKLNLPGVYTIDVDKINPKSNAKDISFGIAKQRYKYIDMMELLLTGEIVELGRYDK